MGPSKTEIQQTTSGEISKTEADNDHPLVFRSDLRFIVGSAVAGLGVLITLSLWIVVGKVQFIVGAAVPLFTLIAIIYQAVIYRRQWLAMERQEKAMRETIRVSQKALSIGNRAYVGVHSLEAELEQERVIVMIENTGNVPAEDVKVSGRVSVVIPQVADGEGSALSRFRPDIASSSFHEEFGRLFRGNLKGRVIIDLYRITLEGKHYLSKVANSSAHGFLVVQGQIEYGDGFESGQVTPFAFTYGVNYGWAVYPVNRSDAPEDVEPKEPNQSGRKNPN